MIQFRYGPRTPPFPIGGVTVDDIGGLIVTLTRSEVVRERDLAKGLAQYKAIQDALPNVADYQSATDFQAAFKKFYRIRFGDENGSELSSGSCSSAGPIHQPFTKRSPPSPPSFSDVRHPFHRSLPQR
jgi:hypothetical protein